MSFETVGVVRTARMAFVSLEELGGINCSLLEDTAALLEEAGALEELEAMLLEDAGACSLSFGTCPLNPS